MCEKILDSKNQSGFCKTCRDHGALYYQKKESDGNQETARPSLNPALGS